MCNYLLTVIVLSLLTPSVYSADAMTLKDPTRPANIKPSLKHASSSLTKTWALTSTLISNGRRNAVINGQLVALGQTIQKAKVVSIQPNEVWLVYNKKRIRIKLLAQNIKDFSISADK